MRVIIMHKTAPRWEAGEIPSRELIARVGEIIGDMQKAKVLRDGDGLRASSLGARVRFRGGKSTVAPGPFAGENELPAGFDALRVSSLDEAVEWATRLCAPLGDGEVDVRPITEAWDIGMGARPANVTTTRYMALRKATPESEAGTPPAADAASARGRALAEAKKAGVHLATETMRPSARGRRYKNTREGVRFTDGPFMESKELIAGYVTVDVPSLEEASKWAERYIDVVGAEEVDVRELEDPS